MAFKGTEHIVAGIEANFQGFLTAIPPALEGELNQFGGVSTYYTGVHFALFNGVISCRVKESELDQRIQETQEYFRSKNVPMLWWVFPSDQPSNLVEALERHGFVQASVDPGMAVQLDGLPEMSPMPGLEIVKGEDSEIMDTWGKVGAAGFGLPDFVAEPFGRACLKISEQQPGMVFNYLALLDGRPVGTSTLYLSQDGVAGIYDVATLEDARKRGIGRALTLQPLLEARNMGYDIGILGASEMGHPVYRALGFKDYCKIPQYFWQPEE
jgi:GNAT superfamily N-acetyltransferase